MPKAPRRRPSLEALESRHLPATFGIPWPDPQHLTLSFMPDGTEVGGAPSTLNQTLNAGMPTTAWEMDILRAFQTWADVANINIGLVGDDGQAPGQAGPLQGNPGFGDIRIGARPLSPGTLAITNPFDLGNDWSGDMLLNSAAAFGDGPQATENLFTAVLHEAGHSLGLPDNPSDPTSVMYPVNTGTITAPSAADIAALQALYGPRAPDTRNDSTFATATPLAPNAVAAVDLPSPADQDVYRVTDTAPGPFVVDLRTSGVSLLTARVTVYNALGQPLATAAAPDPLHGDLTLTIPGASARSSYFIRVGAARSDVFGIGAYRLAAGPAGPALQAVSANPPIGINPAPHGNAQVINLTPQTPGTDARWPYLVQGSLSTPTPSQDYGIRTGTAPTAAMLVTVWADQPGGLTPRVAVFDAGNHPVAAQVVASDAASESIQILSPTPGARYVVEVSAAPGSSVGGNYTLGITFTNTAVADDTLASGTLSASQDEAFLTLDVADAEVFHFDLSGGMSSDTGVSLTVFDASDNVVATLRAQGGAGSTGTDVVLPAGRYILGILGATRTGGALPPIPFVLRGTNRSEPDDPSPVDTTLDPISLPSDVIPNSSPSDLVVDPYSASDDYLILADPFSPLLWD